LRCALAPPSARASHQTHLASPPPPPLPPKGGIGIAAALSVLEELPSGTGAPPPMLLVWTARHPAELLVLAPRLLAAARAKGVTLAAHLHYTGARAASGRRLGGV
jgi:hypothetical protein